MQLNRRFTPLTMLLLSINGMVGSAWLFGPLYAAKIAGASAIISWLLGGFATVIIALTFAELSSMLPIAGGMARFPQLSHGTLTNMIMSWVSWLSCITMPPIEVQATLQYASTYYPALTHLVNDVPVLTSIGMIFATLLMILLCIVNVASFKGLIRFNSLLFIFKVFVIVITVMALWKTNFHPQNFQGTFPGFFRADWHAILAAVASGGIAFAFTGFTHGIALAGETKHSQVAIPLAIIGSVVICLLLYLGLQIAFIGAIDPSSILNGWKNLSFTGEAGPFVGIAAILGLAWLVKLLYIDTVVSPLGAGLIYVTSTARTVYAMSKNGYFPKLFSHINSKGFPIWAIALNFTLGMLLFFLPGWQAMVNFLVSAVVISYAIGPIALLCLRQQIPNEKRPFKLPAARPLCLIAFFFCNLISYWTGWDTIWKLAIAISVGIMLLFVAYFRGLVDKSQFGLRALGWLIPYFAGLFIISYFGSFGGKGYIPFGMDFLVIGIFSIVIMMLAILTRQGATIAQYEIYQQELI
ncbi:MAG: APC family permease [Proteobacteria bacterium]|nr:APC family permease [Pseudomonadota bacterium]